MRIEEHHVVGKTGRSEVCEDEIIANERFVAVVDGVTSPIAANTAGEQTPGKKAAGRIREGLEGLPADIGAFECFRHLNTEIARIYWDEGSLEKARANPEYRCCASVIIYSCYRSELWMIGDCQALVGDRLITALKDAEALLAEVRAMFLESELLMGRTVDDLLKQDTGRAYIRELLIRQRLFQNRGANSPYSHFILDGFLDKPEQAMQVYRVPRSCRSLVLASDGYPYLKPTLRESEQALEEIIKKDPLCFRLFKSTKGVYDGNLSFDDRAYVRLHLG